jgi:hypothetical protein
MFGPYLPTPILAPTDLTWDLLIQAPALGSAALATLLVLILAGIMLATQGPHGR